MKIIKTLYNGKTHLSQFILENDFDTSYTWLVRIHASTPSKDECLQIAKEVKSSVPDATVIGCTVGGVILDGTIYDDKTLIMFTGFERATVVTDFFSIDGKNDTEIAEHIEKSCEGVSPAVAIMHVGGFTPYSERVIERISKTLPNVPFVGGFAGCQDAQGNVNSFVFDEKGVYENTINITYVTSDFVLSYTNAIVGHAPISDVHTITAMTGDYIDEIDGISSVEWINTKLGTTKLQENKDFASTVSTDILVRFPFVLEGRDGSSRFTQYDAQKNKLRQYYSQVENGTKFRIGYVSPVKSVEEWQNLCYDLQNTPVETMFCYSCLFRKLFLNNLSKWEMAPFIEQGVCGAFMFGEIGTKNNSTYYYNGTCSVFTMAEKVHYLKPNLSAYDRIDELDDSNAEMAQTLQNLIKLSSEREDFAIFESALKTEAHALARMQSKDDSMTVFLKERVDGDNLKLCLVSSNEAVSDDSEINGVAAIELMIDIKSYADKNMPDLFLRFYRFGTSSFFFTSENSVSRKSFSDAVKNLYEKFALEEETNHLNFAVTYQGKNPRELLDYIQSSAKIKESSFFDCDTVIEDDNELQSEFKLVEIIKDAIDNDRVIPYFQGIYDSHKNNFFAYESLMRLQTSDGELLTPGFFLDVAKKHGLYLDLSKAMVCKVLDIFAERTEVITLNISSLDIHSEDFTRAVLKRLDKMTNPSHFIFELVETEKFAGQELLRQFIRKLKRYGAKIAIDDFGSGYSNFIEIGNLEIDYIKINGSLTELLGTDKSYDQILDSIHFLSKKMQVELIAECVETPVMQKTLVNHGVRYSQGYLFSRPMPTDQLYIVSEENNIQNTESDNSAVTTLYDKKINKKFQYTSLIWGGFFASLAIIIAIIFFSSHNLTLVEDMNDMFLLEISERSAEKVSDRVSDAKGILETIAYSIFSHSHDENELPLMLQDLTTAHNFDNLYVSISGSVPVDSNGTELSSDIYLQLNGALPGEIKMLPWGTDVQSGKKYFAMALSFYLNENPYAELYGIIYLENFAKVLNLKSEEGGGFSHLFDLSGEPLILSQNTENRYVSGDMYDYVDNLNIQNGNTSEAVKIDIQNGAQSLVKFIVEGEKRTVTFTPIPQTNWCVASVLLNDESNRIVGSINNATIVFVISILFIFGLFLSYSIILNRRNERILKKALESSFYLTNSLQSTIETDTLTNTYSRSAAQEKISEVLLRCEKDKNNVHVIMIADADNFKQINDTYGHQIGDQYLLEFVSALKSSLRSGDILGRLGGDEFVIMLNNITSKENAKTVIERIIINVNAISIKDVDLSNVGISIGAVMVPDYSTDYMQLNNMADKALYKAKHAGKSTYAFYEEK